MPRDLSDHLLLGLDWTPSVASLRPSCMLNTGVRWHCQLMQPSAFQPTYNSLCRRLATPTTAETHCVRAHLSWHLLPPLASQQSAFIRTSRPERTSTISLYCHSQHTRFEILRYLDIVVRNHVVPSRILVDKRRRARAVCRRSRSNRLSSGEPHRAAPDLLPN